MSQNQKSQQTKFSDKNKIDFKRNEINELDDEYESSEVSFQNGKTKIKSKNSNGDHFSQLENSKLNGRFTWAEQDYDKLNGGESWAGEDEYDANRKNLQEILQTQNQIVNKGIQSKDEQSFHNSQTIKFQKNDMDQRKTISKNSSPISGIEDSHSEQDDEKKYDQLDEKNLIKKLKNDLKELDLKKKKYQQKLEDIQTETVNQEQEVKVLQERIAEEVQELNQLNQLIFKQQDRMSKLQEIKDRNEHFQKNLKGQHPFNSQLISEHRQKTYVMQAGLNDANAENENSKKKENNNENNGESNLKFEIDPQCYQLLNDIANFRLGQTLDDVRGNAMILSGISQPSKLIQAIVVKFILIQRITQTENLNKHRDEINWQDIPNFDKDFDDLEKEKSDGLKDIDYTYIDKSCYVATFKVYQNTTFDDILKAACQFWFSQYTKKEGLQIPDHLNDQYVLTDEYFNNLSTYKDYVQNFFSEASGYNHLNLEGQACVFLIRKNEQRTTLHMLQLESAEIQDDNNKKDNLEGVNKKQKDDNEDEEDEFDDKNDQNQVQKPRKINMKKIAETIVGLKTYESKITDEKMEKYKTFMESHRDPSISVWKFICALVLIIINIVGKTLKNDYYTEYLVRKVVESFFNMQYVEDYKTSNLFQRRLQQNQDQDLENTNLRINDLYKGQQEEVDYKKRKLQQSTSNFNFQIPTTCVNISPSLTSPQSLMQQIQIASKSDLYQYLIHDFPQIFFTPGQYAQEKFIIVGPTRLRTIHTLPAQCPVQTDLNTCYDVTLADNLLDKSPKNNVSFFSCEQLGISYIIVGEYYNFGCNGYVIDTYANQTNPTQFAQIVNQSTDVLFGPGARALNIEMTLYFPRGDTWVYAQVMYEYGVQGQQVLSKPTTNYQTFTMNLYAFLSDTAFLRQQGVVIKSQGFTLFIFDTIKLSLYTIFFFYQNLKDIKYLIEKKGIADAGVFLSVIWNLFVSVMNIGNYIIFVLLSRSYGFTNDILQQNEFIDSHELQNLYWQAQIFDSVLVLMNMAMIMNFTKVSRRVSLTMGLIGKTAPYLIYLVLTYILALILMAMIVWQVWGDRLSYFRNISISIIYTLALFDLKSMYLATDFMSANQYGVDPIWLFILIILFAVVLHYSITLQYSAYFHIYFNIAKKYENKIATTHNHLKEKDVLKWWLMGLLKNPFADYNPDEEAKKDDGLSLFAKIKKKYKK